jgi:hypothetical protein
MWGKDFAKTDRSDAKEYETIVIFGSENKEIRN